MWHGIDMEEVYSDWAKALQACSMGAIRHGIELAKARQDKDPPTQGQFLAMCKTYEPDEIGLKLDSKPTPEQVAKNKEKFAEMLAGLNKKQDVTNAQ